MLWDPFLMKFCVKKEVCGSRKQCTGPTRKAFQPHNVLKKKKKKGKTQMQTSAFSSVSKPSFTIKYQFLSICNIWLVRFFYFIYFNFMFFLVIVSKRIHYFEPSQYHHQLHLNPLEQPNSEYMLHNTHATIFHLK